MRQLMIIEVEKEEGKAFKAYWQMARNEEVRSHFGLLESEKIFILIIAWDRNFHFSLGLLCIG